MDVVVVVVIVVCGLGDTSFVVVLIWSLFKAQIGYLNLSKALLICSSSFCILVQTVLALCVRVLKTWYIADRL